MFDYIAERREEWLRAWKRRTGKKLIGCFPMHVPEIPVHAAGALPVVLLGSDGPARKVDQYLPSWLCHPLRSTMDNVLNGELDYIDGLVIADTCDQVKRVADLWRRYLPPSFFVHHLALPRRVDSAASQSWLATELDRYSRALAGFLGVTISDEALSQSVAVYCQNRGLLRELYRWRTEQPGLFRAREIASVVAASMVMPKEEHSALLSDYLVAKKGQSYSRDAGVRLIVSGNLCEALECGIVEAIEDAGGELVGDDLFTGSRYFASPLDSTVPPLEMLVAEYTGGIACPTKHGPASSPGARLVELAGATGARGVVVLAQAFCEIHGWEWPAMQAELDGAQIPSILIEIDHGGTPERVKTRLAAFVEMLRE